MIVETIDSINVTENRSICAQIKTSVFQDDKLISTTFYNHIIKPGDVSSSEDERVQKICAEIHTDEVVKKFNAVISAQGV
jgi:hypothetical protein